MVAPLNQDLRVQWPALRDPSSHRTWKNISRAFILPWTLAKMSSQFKLSLVRVCRVYVLTFNIRWGLEAWGLTHKNYHFTEGDISCKLRKTIAFFAQLLIGIFGAIEPQMSIKIHHLEMLNFFTQKRSQKVGDRAQEFGALYKKLTPGRRMLYS